MMDRVMPGGVAADLTPTAIADIRQLARRRSGTGFPELIELYDNTASLQDRTVGTGILRPDLAAALRLRRRHRPGVRPCRRRAPPPRLSALRRSSRSRFRCAHEGDVDARVWVRIREVEQSLSLIEQILDGLPAGPIRIEPPPVGPPALP